MQGLFRTRTSCREATSAQRHGRPRTPVLPPSGPRAAPAAGPGLGGRSRPEFPAFRGQRAPGAAAPSSTARAREQWAAGSPPRGGGARRGPARGQGGRAPGGGGGRAGENRRGEPDARHGAAGARGSRRGREAGAGPGPAFPARPRGHVRPRCASPRGPSPARRRWRGLTRGGAARVERSRAEQSRKRPGREAGEAVALRRRRKGVGSPAAVAAFASSFRPLRGARRAGGTCHSRQGERGVLRGERRRRRRRQQQERPGTAQRARRGEGCGDDAGE